MKKIPSLFFLCSLASVTTGCRNAAKKSSEDATSASSTPSTTPSNAAQPSGKNASCVWNLKSTTPPLDQCLQYRDISPAQVQQLSQTCSKLPDGGVFSENPCKDDSTVVATCTNFTNGLNVVVYYYGPGFDTTLAKTFCDEGKGAFSPR